MENHKPSKSTKVIDKPTGDHLSLQVKSKLLPLFYQLLGYGFSIPIKAGCNIKDLLCRQLGIQEEYLNQRIKSIFLNSKVVDDVNSTTLNSGSTLALSGPMPGLVGAILRSGGHYAAMRSQISHQENSVATVERSATITLKLLNIIARELGPAFLQQGIRLKGFVVHEFIERHLNDFRSGCISSKLDGKPVEIKRLPGIVGENEMLLLQVDSEAVD